MDLDLKFLLSLSIQRRENTLLTLRIDLTGIYIGSVGDCIPRGTEISKGRSGLKGNAFWENTNPGTRGGVHIPLAPPRPPLLGRTDQVPRETCYGYGEDDPLPALDGGAPAPSDASWGFLRDYCMSLPNGFEGS